LAEPCRPTRRQGTYWIATVPRDQWTPGLPDSCNWIKGQLERGESGYEHWQFIFALKNKGSLRTVKNSFPNTGHYELTVSRKAEEYVWKDETSIGERFELGKKPFKRNSSTDWDVIRKLAVENRVEEVPSDVFIRYYNQLRRISADYLRPSAMQRKCYLLWGATGTGKSFRAWEYLGDAYSKDPRTKWWTGYRGEKHVIIDEFRGGIDIAHILRWTDRYPVQVETKGGATALQAEVIIFTSNICLGAWYPELDPATFLALERRIKSIEISSQEEIVNFE